VTIENKLKAPLADTIIDLLTKTVKQELSSFRADDETGFEEIGSEKEKQNIEKKVGNALRKEMKASMGQRINLVIGDNFAVKLVNQTDYGIFKVGSVKIYIFGANRPSRP
jgi:hypothetical protein